MQLSIENGQDYDNS